MGMPSDVWAVDLMMGIPPRDRSKWSESFAGIRDRESQGKFQHGAAYMFKQIPEVDPDDFETIALGEMDRYKVEKGLMPVTFDEPLGRSLVTNHPNRFVGSWMIDPNTGMDGVRLLERAVRELGVVAANAFPAGTFPQVPIDDRKMYPFYAKCVEFDIPMCINAGVPGPRFPFDCQKVERLDVVCYDFPELKLVTRHGCEPWADLMVKLMLKWPNLYYSTSAFAPRYYPKEVIDFANTRGADKVMYAGYYPSGLSLERIFTEMPGVALRDEVWPKFLRENALRVFRL
jgi:predicted TIM-barrel fold metal-dependent hydrolase